MASKEKKNEERANKNQTSKVLRKPLGKMKKRELEKVAAVLKLQYPMRTTTPQLRKFIRDEKLRLRNADSVKNEQDLVKEDIYNKFVKWYALPDIEKCIMLEVEQDKKTKRYPMPTLVMFANKHGVNPITLTRWKRRKNFMAQVDDKNVLWGIDLTSNVMGSLYGRVMRYGRADDIELWLAYYKNWTKKQVLEHKHERFDMDDVRALLAPLSKEKQEKFYGLLNDIFQESELSRIREENAGSSTTGS